MGAQTYRSADRILTRPDYRRVQSRGKRVHTPHFVILVMPRSAGPCRLGITVTKKVSPSAVQRNRVKRLVREVFRRHRDRFPTASDLVVVAKSGAPSLTYGAARREILHGAHTMESRAAQREAR